MQNKVFLLLIFAKIDRKSMKKWKKFLDRPVCEKLSQPVGKES